MSATKSNLDADSVNDANKPITRARAKIIASQNSQANNENHPLVTNDSSTVNKNCIFSLLRCFSKI